MKLILCQYELLKKRNIIKIIKVYNYNKIIIFIRLINFKKIFPWKGQLTILEKTGPTDLYGLKLVIVLICYLSLLLLKIFPNYFQFHIISGRFNLSYYAKYFCRIDLNNFQFVFLTRTSNWYLPFNEGHYPKVTIYVLVSWESFLFQLSPSRNHIVKILCEESYVDDLVTDLIYKCKRIVNITNRPCFL